MRRARRRGPDCSRKGSHESYSVESTRKDATYLWGRASSKQEPAGSTGISLLGHWGCGFPMRRLRGRLGVTDTRKYLPDHLSCCVFVLFGVYSLLRSHPIQKIAPYITMFLLAYFTLLIIFIQTDPFQAGNWVCVGMYLVAGAIFSDLVQAFRGRDRFWLKELTK